jgi:hypothetical protein
MGLVAALVVVLELGFVPAGRVWRVSAAHGDAMAGHMTMTELRPIATGDKEQADAIVAAARRFADQYTDYHKALADGYVIFHPEIKQDVYHFTDNADALARTLRFDAARPTSLLYERTAPAKAGDRPGYKLVGVMYTAPLRSSMEELDRRVPLSIARWHLHTNLCLPPRGDRLRDLVGPEAKFGLQGSIVTAEACRAAGGTFLPHVLGWMVHVYPYETDPKKIWAAGMDDEHGMEKDAMPAGMEM